MKCLDCEKDITPAESFKGRCGKCHGVFLEACARGKTVDELKAEQAEKRKEDQNIRKLQAEKALRPLRTSEALRKIILTTETAHNLPVSERLEIVAAEVVVGMNVFKDILAGVRNVVGGRSNTIQTALKDIRLQALDELRSEAARVGADAVVGVSLDYQEIGATGSTMLFVIASGTAVKLEKEALNTSEA